MPKERHPPGHARGRGRHVRAALTAAQRPPRSAGGTEAAADSGRRAAVVAPSAAGRAAVRAPPPAARRGGRRAASTVAAQPQESSPGSVSSPREADNLGADLASQIRDLVGELVKDALQAHLPSVITGAAASDGASPAAGPTWAPVAGRATAVAARDVSGPAAGLVAGPVAEAVAGPSAVGVPAGLRQPSAGSSSQCSAGTGIIQGTTEPDFSSQAELPMFPLFSVEAGDLSYAVSPAMRQKIVEHKYIELGALLAPAHELPSEVDSRQFASDGPRPSPGARIVHTFSGWCTAFLRFAGIYLAAHSGDAAGLLAHMRQVSYLHSQGLGYAWREFDAQFRRARELAPSHHRWGAMSASSPIWLNAVASGAGSRAGSAASRASAKPFRGPRRDLCNMYNAGTCRRRPCPYQHACRSCLGPHGAARCPRRGAAARAHPAGNDAKLRGPQ